MTSTFEDLTTRVERLGKGAGQAKSAILDGTTAAARALKRGQYAVEDAVQERIHGIRRKPIASVALAFASGLAIGMIASRLRSE